MRKFITSYDDRWPQLFAVEANALRLAFGESLSAIHHVGSTSIPGMIAKPIIDILVEVNWLAEIDAHAPALELLGYRARGEYGIEGRRYFVRPADAERVGFHVHAYAVRSAHIDRHIRFRDYLRATPQAAQDYATLKLSLRGGDGALVADYQQRKTWFIEEIDRVAKAAN